MLVFSTVADWQGDAAVKQILVFPNQDMKDIFDKDFAALVEKEGIDKASDSNLGAIYKVRAVKNQKGLWTPLIRCGLSGAHLWESEYATYTTSNNALKEAMVKLKQIVSKSFDIQIHSLAFAVS